MRTYKGEKVIFESEFDKQYKGNWMYMDENGKYNNLPRERFVIEECKDTNGKRSTTPYVAVDNTEGCCFMEAYATIDEAIDYLKEEQHV